MDIGKIISEVTDEVMGGLSSYGTNSAAAYNVRPFDVAKALEHSLLAADMTHGKVLAECALARRYCIGAVCVAPWFVSAAAGALRGSGVMVCAAIGFPYGMMSPMAKLADARECIKNGADELDVAVNISAVKSGELAEARADFEQIAMMARGKTAIKAVFEHCLYNGREKKDVLNMVKSLGAEYIKIQNVLSGKGAGVADLKYVRDAVGGNVKIKIDGGVKTLGKAMELIGAGADRIGLTAAIAVAKEAEGAK